MANQRKAGKKKIQVWMTEEERRSLEEKAAKKGMTLTDFLKWIAAGMPVLVALLWFQFPKTRPALRSCERVRQVRDKADDSSGVFEASGAWAAYTDAAAALEQSP